MKKKRKETGSDQDPFEDIDFCGMIILATSRKKEVPSANESDPTERPDPKKPPGK